GRLDGGHRELEDGRPQAPFRDGLFAVECDDGRIRRRQSRRDHQTSRKIYRAYPVARAAAARYHARARTTGRTSRHRQEVRATATADDRLSRRGREEPRLLPAGDLANDPLLGPKLADVPAPRR